MRIVKVNNDSTSILNYLGERGLVPGRSLGVKEVRALDSLVTVEDERGDEHTLGENLAGAIFVQRTAKPT